MGCSILKNCIPLIKINKRENQMQQYGRFRVISATSTKNICPQCKKNKWKTLVKGAKWECRNCGYVKEDKEKLDAEFVLARNKFYDDMGTKGDKV